MTSCDSGAMPTESAGTRAVAIEFLAAPAPAAPGAGTAGARGCPSTDGTAGATVDDNKGQAGRQQEIQRPGAVA